LKSHHQPCVGGDMTENYFAPLSSPSPSSHASGAGGGRSFFGGGYILVINHISTDARSVVDIFKVLKCYYVFSLSVIEVP
jgi:hypothetical protein